MNTKRGRQARDEEMKEIHKHAVYRKVPIKEAYERTGRHLCISVAPAELHQQSRTLNSITTPNVLLRESIQASCAVPGFMEPVKLMARGIGGERVPYVSSRSWIDGSVTDDLPASRLRRIFGCNFFIASQTNPMILWSVQDPNSRGPMSDWLDFWQSASKGFSVKFSSKDRVEPIQDAYIDPIFLLILSIKIRIITIKEN